MNNFLANQCHGMARDSRKNLKMIKIHDDSTPNTGKKSLQRNL